MKLGRQACQNALCLHDKDSAAYVLVSDCQGRRMLCRTPRQHFHFDVAFQSFSTRDTASQIHQKGENLFPFIPGDGNGSSPWLKLCHERELTF